MDDKTGEDEEHLRNDFLRMLPPAYKEAAENHPHLVEYLHLVSKSPQGLPEYHPQLARKLGDNKEPNIIYPTKRHDIFVHVLIDRNDNRNSYIPIEPALTIDVTDLMGEVEIKLLELGVKLPRLDPNQKKEKQFLAYIDLVTTTDKHPNQTGFLDRYFGFLSKNGVSLKRVKVTPRELESIKYLFVRDKVGLGCLEPLIADPYIEDISCSGLGSVFIEHKIFKSLKSAVIFPTLEELDEFVLWQIGRAHV
jgi:flagellar protein FlaI